MDNFKKEAHEYVQDIRARCEEDIKAGKQIDFFDAIATSRMSGEKIVWWMLPKIRELEIQRDNLIIAITKHLAELGDGRMFETAKTLKEIVDEVRVVDGIEDDRSKRPLYDIRSAAQVLTGIIELSPYGCAFCDSGVLRKPGIPEKDHDDDCPYKMARDLLTHHRNTYYV